MDFTDVPNETYECIIDTEVKSSITKCDVINFFLQKGFILT